MSMSVLIKNVKCLALHFDMISDAAVVGTAILLRAGPFWVRIRREEKIFLVSQISRPTLGPTQPPNQLFPGFFPVYNAAGRKANHPHSSSDEIMIKWSYDPTPPIFLNGVNKENSTLLYRLEITVCRSSTKLQYRPKHLDCFINKILVDMKLSFQDSTPLLPVPKKDSP